MPPLFARAVMQAYSECGAVAAYSPFSSFCSDQSGECHLVVVSSEFEVDYFRDVEGRESDDCISGFQLVGQGVMGAHQVYGFGLSPWRNTQADFYLRDRYILLTHEPSILEAHVGQ